MRILCALIPHFPLRCEVKRRPGLGNLPAAITRTTGSKRFVLDYSPDLDKLRSGIAVQEAISTYGEIELLRADVPYYRSVFDEIQSSLEKVSPLVEGTDLGCIYLGMDGLQLIFPNDDVLLDSLRKAIPEVFQAQYGIAGNKFLAYLLAATSSPGKCHTPEGDVSSFLRNFSCDLLPIADRSKQKLHEFGLHTLGQISALASAPLQSQFGLEGRRIFELTRGKDDTPLYPRNSEETIEESNTLPSVTVSMEAILATIESLLAKIFARDALRGRGICSLVLWANIWGNGYWELNVKFKEPAMTVRKALSRIKSVLEATPPTGPVEELGLRLTGLGYTVGRQGNLLSDIRSQDHLLAGIKQLEFRLGGPQLFKMKEVEPWSRIPERRRVMAPITP